MQQSSSSNNSLGNHMLARIADALGTALLNIASRLLQYAERQYGGSQPSNAVPSSGELPTDDGLPTDGLPTEGLPENVRALIEELQQDDEIQQDGDSGGSPQ